MAKVHALAHDAVPVVEDVRKRARTRLAGGSNRTPGNGGVENVGGRQRS